MDTPRILFCSHQSRTDFIGGAEFVLLTLAREADRRQIEPILLTDRDGRLSDAARAADVQVARADYGLFWDFLAPGRDVRSGFNRFLAQEEKNITGLCELLGKENIAAVVSNCLPNFIPLAAARRMGLPTVLLVHELPYAFDRTQSALRQLVRRLGGPVVSRNRAGAMAFLKEQILAHSDVTVFVSEKSRRGFFGPAPPEGRSMQLYPPVRSEVLDPPPAADRSFPGIPDSLFSVVFLGMVLRHKGVHDFVSAGLKALRVNPGLHFTIAGARPDPGYDERLRQTVAASGREDHFLFVDFIENPLPLYDRADVVSMPSLYEEPCGLVISEAMSRGKAVVAYETGSVRELIRDGEDGFIVPRGDVRALAERVEFLERNRSACRKLGERATKTARRRAAPGPWAGRVQEVIQRVIARA